MSKVGTQSDAIQTPQRSQRIPNVRGHFVWGNMRELQRNPLAFFTSAMRQYGDIFRYRLAFLNFYFIGHPEYVRRVLQDNHQNYSKDVLDFKMLKWVTEEGLLASDGAFWLRQRRLAQPAFHRQRIAGFGTMITAATAEMLDRWQVYAANQQPLDVTREMTALTLRVVGQALFSTDTGSQADRVGQSFTLLSEDLVRRFRSMSLFPPVLPTRRDRRFRQARRELNTVVYEIINARRRHNADQGDLLAMLMQARDEETGATMDDDQLRAEVKTLLLAGHETTANLLSWTWYLLAQHPEVEQRLHAELVRVLGGRLPTVTDLPQLRYTRMVIDETLRLYPPAWIIPRKAARADQFGHYRIPAQSALLISPYVTHRHPEFWETPERFDPERFTPERAAARPRYAYFPFGGGPRLCIGNNFALMEAQLIVSTIAQRYRLRLVPEHPVEPEALITLRPRHGLPMRLQDVP